MVPIEPPVAAPGGSMGTSSFTLTHPARFGYGLHCKNLLRQVDLSGLVSALPEKRLRIRTTQTP